MNLKLLAFVDFNKIQYERQNLVKSVQTSKEGSMTPMVVQRLTIGSCAGSRENCECGMCFIIVQTIISKSMEGGSGGLPRVECSRRSG